MLSITTHQGRVSVSRALPLPPWRSDLADDRLYCVVRLRGRSRRVKRRPFSHSSKVVCRKMKNEDKRREHWRLESTVLGSEVTCKIPQEVNVPTDFHLSSGH